MSYTSSLLITSIFFLVTALIFIFAPFGKKSIKIIILSILTLTTIGLTFIPDTYFCEIKLPIFNSTINEFLENFLNETKHYLALKELQPGIDEKIFPAIHGIVKMCFIYIVIGLALLVSTLVFSIIYFVRRRKIINKKYLLPGILSSLTLIILSFSITITPLYAIGELNVKIHEAIGQKETDLVYAYEEYKKYEPVLDFLDFASESLLVEGIVLPNLYLSFMDIYKEDEYDSLSDNLYVIYDLGITLNETGIPKIFKDSEFTFAQTKKDTFDLIKLDELISTSLQTEYIPDVAFNLTNEVLAHLEKEIALEFIDIDTTYTLKMTKDQFIKEYPDLLELLDFVIDYDFINLLRKYNINRFDDIINLLKTDIIGAASALIELVNKIFNGNKDLINRLKNILNMPIVSRVQKLTKTDLIGLLEVAIYLCSKLYDMLDSWLEEYKSTYKYKALVKFMYARGFI